MRRHLGRATALGVAARRRKAGNLPLLRTLQELGVATSLELCLDAADYASYTGSGQSWLDTSGNGYDFFRGADGNASTDDPTWNGTAGALTKNEYWSFDGGDYFTYDTTNETWMNALHQNNAAFSLALWVYVDAFEFSTLAATSNGNGAAGIQWQLFGTAKQNLAVKSTSGAALTQVPSGADGNANAWNFFAFSLDESVGAGGINWNTNGVAETDTSTYTTPDATDASQTLTLFSQPNGNTKLPAGHRVAQFMAWSRALSAAELSDIYTKTRTRFGV